ncbi:hypothetical protein ACFXKK_35670 [Streptomyces globisporus]|uniref:hypothetical protein n=1 Tax=Streptomyces globisporus TaxID=1908 RepID=UPI003648263D
MGVELPAQAGNGKAELLRAFLHGLQVRLVDLMNALGAFECPPCRHWLPAIRGRPPGILAPRTERGGQGVFSSRDEVEFGGELDSMPLWFLLYERNDAGEISAELSLPVKMEGQYVNKWSERIPLFIHTDPGLDIALLDAPDNGDEPDFDIRKAH